VLSAPPVRREHGAEKGEDMPENRITHIAIIGTGTMGGSWAAYFLARGLDVVATDLAPGAEANLRRGR
jgi:hypothetical protein